MVEVVFVVEDQSATEVSLHNSYLLRRSVGRVVFTGWLVCRSGEVVGVAHQNVWWN